MFLIHALAAKIWTQVREGLFSTMNFIKKQKLQLADVKKHAWYPANKALQLQDGIISCVKCHIMKTCEINYNTE